MPETMETVAAIMALSATIWLTLGLFLAHLLRKQPARAHGVLVAALVGTLITPVLFYTVRLANFGLLGEKTEPSATAITEPVKVASSSQAAPGRSLNSRESGPSTHPAAFPRESDFSQSGKDLSRSIESPAPTDSGRGIDIDAQEHRFGPFSWTSLAYWGWFVLSLVMALRLLIDFYAGRRLVQKSCPITEDQATTNLARLAKRMGSGSVPGLSESEQLSSPVLWAWSHPPRILIPTRDRKNEASEAVYLHELAHLARRDHLCALVSELVLCLLPWHPLAWWARRALAARSEEACDDWAIACGCNPFDYADELVNLAPSASGVLTMAAVSRESSLKQRVNRLIRGSFASPRLGRGWLMGLGLIAFLAASGFAMLQPREMRAEGREILPTFEPVVERADTLAPVPAAVTQGNHSVRVHAKGMPVSGAKVWIEHYVIENHKFKHTLMPGVLKTNEFGIAGIPHSFNLQKGLQLAYAEDDAGRFGLINAVPVEGNTRELEITPTKTIRGRVVHEGKPLSGVACQLVSFKWLDHDYTVFQDYPFPKHRESPRSLTNENGEFSFQGIPDTFAGTVLLDKEGFGLAKVSIRGDENTTIELARAGELQVNFPGEGGSARISKMYWFLKDLSESTATSAPLRISYGRLWRLDSIQDGKILRLGAGKYQFFIQHLGAEPFDPGNPVDLEIQPGRTTAITLRADPLAEISGRVVQEKTGKGIEGVRVMFNGGGSGRPMDYLRFGEVQTDATGRFAIHCKGDENYSLRFAHTDLVSEDGIRYYQKKGPFDGVQTVRLKKNEKLILPDVVMNPGIRHRRAVTDEKGKALALPFEAFLATSQLISTRPNHPQIKSARGFSFEQGAVLTPQLDPDLAMAILVRKGKAVNIPEFLVPSAVQQPQAIVVSGDNALAVRGSVVDAEGKPVKGARLQLSSGPIPISRISIEEATSNADGMFEFTGLWPGLHYRLNAEIAKDEWLEGYANFDTLKKSEQQVPHDINDLKIVVKVKTKK